MMKTLISLNDFNTEARKQYFKVHNNTSMPNGIECPTCKNELWDNHPAEICDGIPPKKKIHCPACGFHGNRIC